MAHTLLYILGYNAPEDAILPPDWDWTDPARLNEAMKTLTHALRPWTIDFHVAQNDATVKGAGTHDKTGHHCLPNDPDGKLKIAHHAGYWLHGDDGKLTRAFQHICWDGCMFPNAVMMKQETWNDILSAMISVRDAHGWREDDEDTEGPEVSVVEKVEVKPRAAKPAARKPAKTAPKKAARPAAKKAAKKVAKKPAKKAAKKKPAKKAHAKVVRKSKVKAAKAKPRKTSGKAKKPARKKPAKRRR
jgi:hypothetical protein